MKSIIRTISVLVVVNLLVAGLGLAEKAHENAAVLDAELSAEFETTPVELENKLMYEPVPGVVVEPVPGWKLPATLPNTVMAPQYGGSETVLVIPTDQMKPEELPTIMEDLNIMSRIFDKKLNYVRNRILSVHEFRGYKPFISGSDGGTKAIYVQGFAALFLVKVDFPLLPAPEVQEDKTKEPADPVWNQTKQEIYSQLEYEKSITWFSTGGKIMRESTLYDAEKVDDLKQTLTKSLKHAANIRNLKPDEWVVVTVTGAVQPAVIEQKVEQAGKMGSRIIPITPDVSETRSCSTVLTISVKKSDVDAFAKSELDYDQFRKKTQIVLY